jgi:hypothetical protein
MKPLGCVVGLISVLVSACGSEPASVATDSSVGVDATSDTSIVLDTGTATEDTSTPPPLDTGTVVVDAAPETGVPCTETSGKSFAGHCYFPITARIWSDARDNCISLGAHLVSINSAAEQTFVESMSSGDRWLGMWRTTGKPVVADSYVWITSEPTTFTHWATGEPTGMTGLCARMRADGFWANTTCSTNLIGICERE